jgi:hypothetical protein
MKMDLAEAQNPEDGKMIGVYQTAIGKLITTVDSFGISV